MKKKKLMKKLIFGFAITVIGIILIYLIYYFISIYNIKKNYDNMAKITSEIKNNNSYIFIDVNPSLTLSIHNDKVIKLSCRNKDCSIIRNEFSKIINLNIVDAIEQIYEISNKHGFDTSNGVSIQTTETLSQKISNIKYVNVKIIDKETEEKLLEKNEDDITNNEINKNEQLEQLKKDKDYGEIYTCKENNSNIECYLNEELEINFNNIVLQKRIASVLNRFGIKTESAWEMGIVEEPLFKIYIDGSKFVNTFGDTIGDMEYIGTYSCNTARFRLSNLNLLNPKEIQKHFYTDEHDIVNEAYTDEIQADNSGERFEVYGKKHVVYWNYYCNIETQNWDATQREAYVIYKIDGSYSEEVSKEAYLDFKTELGVYMKDIQECEFESQIVEGKKFKVLKKPNNGKYCKYNNIIEYYSPDGYKLFEE